MQFGVFSVADVTRDPVTGITPSPTQRIEELILIARIAEEVGLDVFAVSEHHDPHFICSSPTIFLAAVAAQTSRIILSTAVTLITANDPVRIAEEYALLQHICHGRSDLMVSPGNTLPVHSWKSYEARTSMDMVIENYYLLTRLWREEGIEWDGSFHTPLIDFTSTPRPYNKAPFVWHNATRFPGIADQAAFYGDGFFVNNLGTPPYEEAQLVAHYRNSFERYGHGRADQAIVGLGGQVFIAQNSQDAYTSFRPYFEGSVLYGMTLDEAVARTSLAVGSVQQVVEKLLTTRELYGDYQRQLFWIDPGGLPLWTVLEQLELLGSAVVPILKSEFDRYRPRVLPPILLLMGGNPGSYHNFGV
ncbi:MAG: LLM class flavin-dependent oxidoreductase [Propionibacteriaceae bacterium]|jgi:putative FMN-dependent luciferase-like monooxygenase|nr:LLM class flavin-dependent oxidoreductase [Propionibacteriaceae bacterium]